MKLLIPISSDARSPEVYERVRRRVDRVAQLESGETLLYSRDRTINRLGPMSTRNRRTSTANLFGRVKRSSHIIEPLARIKCVLSRVRCRADTSILRPGRISHDEGFVVSLDGPRVAEGLACWRWCSSAPHRLALPQSEWRTLLQRVRRLAIRSAGPGTDRGRVISKIRHLSSVATGVARVVIFHFSLLPII